LPLCGRWQGWQGVGKELLSSAAGLLTGVPQKKKNRSKAGAAFRSRRAAGDRVIKRPASIKSRIVGYESSSTLLFPRKADFVSALKVNCILRTLTTSHSFSIDLFCGNSPSCIGLKAEAL